MKGRMKMKKTLAVLLSVIMVFSMTACGSSSGDNAATPEPAKDDTAATTEEAKDTVDNSADSQAAGDSKGIIAFSTKTITNNEFQRVMVEEAQKVVEAAGYTFELILSGDELAVAKQVENIENEINKKVTGLIVAPMDGNAILPALQKAQDAGIPVIIADAAVDEGNEALYATYVGSDNYAIGQEAAKQMIEKVGEGEVVMVRGASGAMGGELRAQGFTEGLEGSSVKLVNEQSGEWQSDVAMQVTENMLTANPDAKGVFLCSDAMLSGVMSACQNKGKTGEDMCIISVDGNISALEAIEAGNCYGCVAQYPGKIGQKSAEIMVEICDGTTNPDSLEKFIDSGYFFMCPDTLDESKEVAY